MYDTYMEVGINLLGPWGVALLVVFFLSVFVFVVARFFTP